MLNQSKTTKVGLCFLVIQLATTTLFSPAANASIDPILGAAGNFQIVSGAATSIGGAVIGLEVVNLSSATNAVSDVSAAITNLAAKPATSVPADLGGKTYLPGVYAAVGGAAFAMTSNIILDGKNDCNSQFIFVTPAAMNTTAGISVTLINGAKPNNVYWVVGAATTIAASSNLSGNFLSAAAITVGASSILDGRLLAIAAVTVGASVVFQGFPISGCSAPVRSLSISVPTSVPSKNLSAGETLTIEMGTVEVIDLGGSGSWTVTATCLTLHDGFGHSMSGENLGYAMSDLTKTEGLLTHPIVRNTLNSTLPVLTASDGPPNNGASWMPMITISVPIDQFGGTYTGSIIHSVF